MATTKATDKDQEQPATASTTTTAAPKPPRLGETITVKAQAGRKVPNNAAGDYFDEKAAVPVTVDARILRLLKDDDLVRVK